MAVVLHARAPRQVLFVSGPGGDAIRYRCLHQAELLRFGGITADVCYHGDADVNIVRERYDCVVLYRVPFDDQVALFCDASAAGDLTVVTDLDDLVFSLAFAPLLRELEAMTPDERGRREWEMSALGETLRRSDAATVSTHPLMAVVAAKGRDVALMPNVVSVEMVRRADEARRRRARATGVTFGYFSGTPTHDADFQEVSDALLELLARDESAHLLVVGFLSLDPRFRAFGSRVEHVPLQPWGRLPRLMARVDVNLAPLEAANEFTNAKSCIKYLEAALLGVPTIASPRDDFVRVIEDGVNGLLSEGHDAWAFALDALARDPRARAEIGELARSDVLANHTTAARAADGAGTFLRIARVLPAPARRRPPSSLVR